MAEISSTDIELHQGITDIDFERWASELGVRAVFLDVEGTVTEYGSRTVPPEIINHITRAKQLGQITAIGLVSNSSNQPMIESVREQLGADLTIHPKEREHRKPSPYMLNRLASVLGLEAGRVGVVGDKYTADIKAAQRAGVAVAAWVKRLGKADHPGDRIFRRPLEAVIRFGIQYDNALADLTPQQRADLLSGGNQII
jgi:HAD superfamily hydrolase (TIGR01662 family)